MSRRFRWLRRLVWIGGGLAISLALGWVLILGDLPERARSSLSGDRGLAAGNPTTLIVDRNGHTLYRAMDPAGSHYSPIPLSQIPPYCRSATIATEDRHFYEHSGVDFLAIGRAALRNIGARSGAAGVPYLSGASTLTQQLARNLLLTSEERAERSLRRKLREAWLAWRLERAYGKDQLLELYLNTTYYGNFSVGIEAAAQAYFAVHARDLDLAQCALLAGLPQYPAGYNPVVHPESARLRQQTVLDLMVEAGYVDPLLAHEARGEQLSYASAPFSIEAPHFVMWVREQLDEIIGTERVLAGGLVVTTTLDLDWQQAADEISRRRLAQLRSCSPEAGFAMCDAEAGIARRVDNAALVALDPDTGAVLALVGSPDYFDRDISGAVNGALSLRQPGSAVKPLTYAAALDPGRAAAAGHVPWTAATVIDDVRTVFRTREGQPYVPENYDRAFHGPVTLRAALANSYNVPAVKALAFIGVDALLQQAQRQGIAWDAAPRALEPAAEKPAAVEAGDEGAVRGGRVEAAGYGLALTLGGAEVRLLDLTAAYGAFAAGGYLVTPYAIQRVASLDGQVLYDASPPSRTLAVDPRVAFLITDILSDERARVPAFGAGNVLEIGRPAAAKTGTSTDWRDNWTVGYSPDLVVGVWVGNADNAPMRDTSGVTGAGPIWHDFMARVEHGTPIRQFAVPDGLVRLQVCADSGLLPGPAQAAAASESCPHRQMEWFIAGTEPSEIDPRFRMAGADPQAARSIGVDRSQPSPRSGQPGFLLTSPDPGRTYRLDPGIPAAAQKLPVSVQPGSQIARPGLVITLLVDGLSVGVVGGPEYETWWPLAVGRHILQAEARAADGLSVLSPAVAVEVVY